MTTQYKVVVLFVAVFFTTAQSAVAQDKDKENLGGDVQEITTTLKVRMAEANKIELVPSLPPIDTSSKKLKYNVPAHPVEMKYEAPTLRPIAVKAAEKQADYRGFARLGAGSPTSFLGEGGYYFGKTDNYDGRIYLKHHQLSADRALENQRFSSTAGALSGNYYQLPSNLAVSAKIGYNYDRVHFYGYDHETTSFTREATRQDYKLLDFTSKLYNRERTDMDLNFSLAPRVYLLNDYYSNREIGFDMPMTATKWFNEKHALRLVLRPDITTFTDTNTQKLNNIYLQPSFTFHADAVQFKLGANFVNHKDVFSIFPDVDLTLRIWGEGIQAFAGANGDLRKNTYLSMSRYNPFIQIRASELRNTSTLNFYGGVKGNVGFIEYNAQIGYNKANDLALYQTIFQPDPSGALLARFATLYDSASIFNMQFTAKIKPVENLVLTATASQNVYSLSNQEAAFGLPEIEGNFGAVYSLLENKMSLKANFYMADKIAYRDELGVLGKSSALYDLSLGGSYYFAKNVGAFLDINNILNNKRERWYRYPMVGLNFMIGVTARF